MGEWPLDEAEHREIGKYFKGRLCAHIARPLIDYVETNRIDWHEIAPGPAFNYAVVHLWSTGARAPNRKHIAEIKRLNGLPDADVPIPDASAVYIVAKADTITWIRDRWFAAPGDSGKVITPHQVRAFDIAEQLRRSQISKEGVSDSIGMLEAIRAAVPWAEVWTLADLARLRRDWEHAHCGFNDADIEGQFSHEH